MKKIFISLLYMLTAGVGSMLADGTQAYKVKIKTHQPLYYNGEVQEGVTFSDHNCSDHTDTGFSAKNAGDYTATSICWCTVGSSGTAHNGAASQNWSIQPRDISKTTGYSDGLYVAITVKDQKWTGSPIELKSGENGIYTIKFKDADLEAVDYDVYITKENSANPVTILEEGRYTIVFTGKGNFTGTVTKTFDVKKEMADPAEDNGDVIGTGIYFYIPTQILIDGKFTGLKMEAKDQKSHATLYEGKDVESEEGDYLLVYFEKKADAEAYKTAYNDSVQAKKNFDNGTINVAAYNQKRDAYRTAWNKRIKNVTEAIHIESRYWFVAIGIAPKYQGIAIHEFYTASEYQMYMGSDENEKLADVTLRIIEPGYPVAETSPTGEVVKGKMEVSPRVIKTLTIGSGSDAVTINYPEGATWSYIIKSNPDKLEKKTDSPRIYKKGTNAFVMYRSGNDITTSANIADIVGSATQYWWESIE